MHLYTLNCYKSYGIVIVNIQKGRENIGKEI